jgi:hypothetical protein
MSYLGETWEKLHENNLLNRSKWERYIKEATFKFQVSGFHKSLNSKRQVEIMVIKYSLSYILSLYSYSRQESFSYMAFQGPIELKNPEVTMMVSLSIPTFILLSETTQRFMKNMTNPLRLTSRSSPNSNPPISADTLVPLSLQTPSHR